MRLSGINIYALIFLTIYSLSVTRIYIPAVNYLFCKDYIVENFCINRNNPSSNCEGKCYLIKETGKVAQEESGKSNTNLQMKAEEIPSEAVLFQPLFIAASTNVGYNNYSNLYSFQFLSTLLHPPGC